MPDDRFLPLRFVPIDDAARDGACRLVRSPDGHQHAARWKSDQAAWFYSCGTPIAKDITEYAARR